MFVGYPEAYDRCRVEVAAVAAASRGAAGAGTGLALEASVGCFVVDLALAAGLED